LIAIEQELQIRWELKPFSHRYPALVLWTAFFLRFV
jgi:hypothetical protein